MIVKAKSEDFIWLIVGIFWVIAQIAGAAAKKKQKAAAESGDGQENERPVDPLSDFLRKIAGTQEFRIEPPELDEEPEEENFQTAWKPGEIEALPDIQPLHRIARTQSGMYPAAPNLNPSERAEVDIRPKMTAFRSSLRPIKQPSMNLNFAESAASGASAGIGSILKPADKAALRRAMLGHILLGKPKALQTSPFGNE